MWVPSSEMSQKRLLSGMLFIIYCLLGCSYNCMAARTSGAAFVTTKKSLLLFRPCTEQRQQGQGQVQGKWKQQQLLLQLRQLDQQRYLGGVQPLQLISNSNWLATIDSDIASIPDNEFATVFAGGIVVMLGGVLSALVVGFILDNRNLYANVVADSYAQGAEDEEFWKGLSEEERKKTQELLQKLKDGEDPPTTTAASAPTNTPEDDGVMTTPPTASSQAPPPDTAAATTATSTSNTPAATEAKQSKDKKDGDMFSDY